MTMIEANNPPPPESPSASDIDTASEQQQRQQQQQHQQHHQQQPENTSSSMITDKRGGTMSSTCTVLACGYREIASSKSGLTFPTFLVELPTGQKVWRSKRDFLLLGRVKTSSSSSSSKSQNDNSQKNIKKAFPFKACLKKLAEKVPWKRPDRDDLPACCSGSSSSNDDNGDENMYHISMKKSLLQLDQFLESVQVFPSDEARVAWDLFCRPEDTEGLIIPTTTTPQTNETNRQTSIVPNNENNDCDNNTTSTSAARACQLGQYFCSPENAKIVVDIVLDKIFSSSPSTKSICKSKDDNNNKILFVEPSCGHGDIVARLVQELDDQQQQLNDDGDTKTDWTILGLDIDPNAIAVCNSRNDLITRTNNTVSFRHGNFLESKNYITSNDDNDNDTPNTTVVCLGGPPYTTGAGSGSDMQRDLPTQFIHHCLLEWKASLICFLLPARYGTAAAAAAKTTSSPSSPPTSSSRNIIALPDGFQATVIELSSSKFYFQGSVPVTQPSIILCVTRI